MHCVSINKIPLLLEGVPGGRGSDANDTAKPYLDEENGGVASNGCPEGGVVTQRFRPKHVGLSYHGSRSS